MARQAKIIVFGGPSANDRLASGLQDEAFDVVSVARPADMEAVEGSPDLVLIDATEHGGEHSGEHGTDRAADHPGDRARKRRGVIDAVRACRAVWPPQQTQVLVLGVSDPAATVEAIKAGATDAIGANTAGPVLSAHVHRLLQSGEALKAMLDEERRRVNKESLAYAAADVAVPLGAMLDELESVMARQPAGERLDDLLELAGQAVDAVDRLRRLATDGGSVDEMQNG